MSSDVDADVGEYDDMSEDEQDDCVECPGNASDEDCMEDGGQEENDEQDIENYEDFATDLLESSGSIYDQPEDAHPEEDNDPTTMLSREENNPECSTTAQHKENTPHPWAGYKIVGDNVDKNIRPSFQDRSAD